MGLDYWLVHFTWTIPPAVLLTAAYWPFFTKLEITKICILINIAVLATIPWDSYLIRSHIWTYPPDAVVGIKFCDIPIEEIFFFIIQTYCTSLLYTILTKHLVLPAYLLDRSYSSTKYLGSSFIIGGIGFGALGILSKNELTYLGLILTWSLTVILFQWLFCAKFLLTLPQKQVLMPILIPTIYLWVVDLLSLQRGTWVIEKGTKLEIQFWGVLDIEEAAFFLLSNVMVVFGMIAMDNAIALAQYDIATSESPGKPLSSFGRITWAYMTKQRKSVDVFFLAGLHEAVTELSRKSQSMYLGSAMFRDGLRVDLIFLYYFCRVIDDLVDEAPNSEKAQESIKEASRILRRRFSINERKMFLQGHLQTEEKDTKNGPARTPLLNSIALLPASRLSIDPLIELLSGFQMDLLFSAKDEKFPIQNEADLEKYALRVAGTVATSLLELIFSHSEILFSGIQREKIINAGQNMGQALQYVNIARDIKRDAAIGRVYIPTEWLSTEGLTPTDVIRNPDDPVLEKFENQMLAKANAAYQSTIGAIDLLPKDVQGPVRTTIESYMMIGKMVRKVRKEGIQIKGKLRVPLWRRLKLAWMEIYAHR